MKKYIALLRGINISGKNKIPMPLLTSCFERCGFAEVKTYINSGNVIFSSELEDIYKITNRCKKGIMEEFQLDVPVVVLTAEELEEALKNAPEWWDVPSEEEMVHQMIFLIPPVTVSEVNEAVGEAKPEYEKVGYYEDKIFWSAKRKTLSRTRWYKIASSKVNDKVTIRNASTVKKLNELLHQ